MMILMKQIYRYLGVPAQTAENFITSILGLPIGLFVGFASFPINVLHTHEELLIAAECATLTHHQA
jgi:hypothetical protein